MGTEEAEAGENLHAVARLLEDIQRDCALSVHGAHLFLFKRVGGEEMARYAEARPEACDPRIASYLSYIAHYTKTL